MSKRETNERRGDGADTGVERGGGRKSEGWGERQTGND